MTQSDRKRRSTRVSKVVSTPTATKMQVIWQNENVREFLAEFISTYVMMVFGLGAVAHMVLGGKLGSYLAVNLGFGFGVTIGVHMAGNISGAHMNAALTFTSCALGRMSWKKFPVYVLGQFLGSFVAAATIYGLFYNAIIDFSGGKLMTTGPTATANIFATYLPDHMTLWRGFLDEVVVTGMLQLCLLAIADKGNNPTLLGTQAIVTGILVVIIGISLGMNSGYAINPSRDLPPRFFTFLAGWGSQVFRTKDWWWVPVVAPPLGAYCGAIIYLFFIGSNKRQEPQVLENPLTLEDHRISVLPKTTSHQPGVASLTPVSVYPEDRPSVLYHP
ncbi:aquaporin-7 isoform X1 [Bubalus kerabau]|uniref:aquaporin-7 isoform X1 n=1 Tax=Bubalus bubalis TaxID=89462 RepID=UPI00042CD764|nr:aquaporin-7 isoform X1 [Bubalus bubalis]XP_006066761.1 aquaporin-7 isoform X1 [Bubalus bubalis]XP_055434794.1 aquaporin-7 isoform X1 [Bubalus carabanensis]XP_055434795.1 aquaporin-7 isoform X1 [Bubalus carabanensis]UBX27111.1 aquaporin 7 [Bubalus bubalis]UBX27113.1 aquaporin 7 [Bubalus bubalis]